jgi:ribonuclease P protein component
MLSSENRLTKKKDFDRVFKEGYSSFDKIIGIKVAVGQEKINRFGVIVSNKVSKKAVDRNKIKRRIKSVLNKEQEKLKQNFDIIIITLPPILKAEFSAVEEAIKKRLSVLKLYK